jgi:hypothetical protein
MKIEFEESIRIKEASIVAFEEMLHEYENLGRLYIRLGDKDVPIEYVNECSRKSNFFLVGNEFGYLALIYGSEEDCLNWYAEKMGPEEYEDVEDFNLGYMNDGGTWISEITMSYMHMREIRWDELHFVFKKE